MMNQQKIIEYPATTYAFVDSLIAIEFFDVDITRRHTSVSDHDCDDDDDDVDVDGGVAVYDKCAYGDAGNYYGGNLDYNYNTDDYVDIDLM